MNDIFIWFLCMNFITFYLFIPTFKIISNNMNISILFFFILNQRKFIFWFLPSFHSLLSLFDLKWKIFDFYHSRTKLSKMIRIGHAKFISLVARIHYIYGIKEFRSSWTRQRLLYQHQRVVLLTLGTHSRPQGSTPELAGCSENQIWRKHHH